MGNIVGARISDSLYNKMAEDKKTNTEIIREALNQYFFNNEKKNDVNRHVLGVNNKKNKDKYKTTSEEIDEFLRGLK
jgi:hypothetical protein